MSYRALVVLVSALAAGCATTVGPVQTPAPPPAASISRCTNDGTLGLEVAELSRAARGRLTVAADVDGALVTGVFPGGPAARAGIAVGDIVTAIAGQPVINDCDVAAFGYGRDCTEVAVEIWRKGESATKSVAPVDAMSYLARLCERGDAQACFRQGWLLWSRGETPAARATAIPLYERACRDGSAAGCAYLGIALPDVGGAARQAAVLERACGLDDPAGCAHLAFSYASGTNVPRDDAYATKLYVKSCELGDAKGCYNVGLMYGEGRGVPRDAVRAAQAYEDGCRNGSAMACTNLGWMVQQGVGSAADPLRAADLYRRGCEGTRCEGPNLLACVNLGRAFRDGIGVAVDPARAAELFGRVCDGAIAGESDEPAQTVRACALLGGMHLAGSVASADAARGRALSERGCAGGDDFGCFNAATAHAHGMGGPVDDAKAATFYDRGCVAGDAESCFELAARLTDGRGVARDRARARTLREKACASGFARACTVPPVR